MDLNKDMHQLSIRIPTINNPMGVINAIESILVQDYKDYDLAVIDNGSSPEYLEDIKKYLKDKDDVQLMINPDKGLAQNWNYCINSCTGNFLLIFHHDDLMLPGMLSSCMELILQDKRIGLVHTNCTDLSIASGKRMLRKTQNENILLAGKSALSKIAGDYNWACSSVIVRKQCYEELGLFIINDISPDWEMFARIAAKFDIGHIDKALVQYNVSSKSAGPQGLISNSPREIMKQWELLGNRILQYFDYKDQAEAEKLINQSYSAGLLTASITAFKNGLIFYSFEYFYLLKKYLPKIVWLSLLLKYLFKYICVKFSPHQLNSDTNNNEK